MGVVNMEKTEKTKIQWKDITIACLLLTVIIFIVREILAKYF